MQSPSRSFVFLASLVYFSTGCNSESRTFGNGEGGSTASSGGSAAANGGSTGTGGATGNGGAATGNGGSTGTGGSGNGRGGAPSSGGSSAGGASAGSSAGGMSGSSGGANSASGGMAAGGASAGAGTGGAASGGCAKGSDTLFCEDFESSATGTVTKTNGYSPVTNMGTLTVDGTHARGTHAMHVHTDGNGKAYIQLSPFAPPQNSFFGRMYIWVTAFPTAPNYAHFTLVEGAGTPSSAGVIRPIGGQYIDGKGDLWGTGSDGGPTSDWTNWKESAPAEAGKWLCMEWEMTAANNAINVWIDGTAKTDLSVSTKTHGGSNVDFVFPTFNSVWFGWWLYQSGPTPSQFDLWIDDISLGTKRQGC